MQGRCGSRVGRLATLAAVAACIGAMQALPARADVYTFDPGHTNVTFSWNNLGLSRQSGRILRYQGTLEFDPLRPEDAKVEVALEVASLSTGVTALDRDLRSTDFLDAARYPEITFKSTLIRRTGERTGEVAGDLTIMNQTHPVVLQVRWNYTGEHPLAQINPTYSGKFVSGFSAATTIMRSKWAVDRAVPLVSDAIEITIETELSRQ